MPLPTVWDQLIVLVVLPVAELLTASKAIVEAVAVPNPPIEKLSLIHISEPTRPY